MCRTCRTIWLIAFAAASLGIQLVNANCGEVYVTRPLIIGGSDSLRGEWPFAVALFRVDNGKYFCGGTLISHQHVLTAAHCVQTKNSMNVRSPDNVIVHLGAHNLSASNEEGAVRINVIQIEVHDDWEAYGDKYDADIALLTLSENVTFSNYTQPVCIPEPDETVGTILNFKGYIIGWAPSNRSRVETPKHAMTTVLNASYCFEEDPSLARHSSQRTFCGWDDDGFPDTGDSGGGLLVLSGAAWVQVGIIAATRTNRTGHVSSQSPAIYTNVREFRSWIVERTHGAVSVANGMKLILNCIYLDLYVDPHIYYTCIAHDLDIKNKNHEVFKFDGEHEPLKSNRDVEAVSFYNGTMLYLPDKIGISFPNLKFLATTRVGTLKSISRTNLQNMENLVELTCQNNKIEVIEEDALWELPNLEVLSMEGNLLEMLHEKTFDRNPKLRTVDFLRNRIRFLPKGLFKNNLQLEEVDFGFNFLVRIEVQFRDQPNIKEISFHENVCISSDYNSADGTKLSEFNDLIIANCTAAVRESTLYQQVPEIIAI